MSKVKQIIIQSLPLALGIALTNVFWESNSLLFFAYAFITIGLILFGKDRKAEIFIMAYGMIAGLAIEAIGTSVGGYQQFMNPQIFGIPYWLVIVWGYGFVLMKRIGLIFAVGSPWVRSGRA